MKIIEDFVSRDNRRYGFKIGNIIASALTGFVCGALVASIILYTVFRIIA